MSDSLILPIQDVQINPTWCAVTSFPPTAESLQRVTESHEIRYIMQGHIEWQYGQHRHIVHPGDLWMATPHIAEQITWDETQTTRFAYIQYIIPPTSSALAWPCTLVHTGSQSVVPHLVQHIIAINRHRRGQWKQEADYALRTLLSLVLNDSESHVTDTNQIVPAAIERLFLAIRAQWKNGLCAFSSDVLAGFAGCSRSHLFRLFKNHFDCSPDQLLMAVRLEMARDLLSWNDWPIHQIATYCGFSCPYHFSRSFRTATTHAPSRFRKKTRAGETLSHSWIRKEYYYVLSNLIWNG